MSDSLTPQGESAYADLLAHAQREVALKAVLWIDPGEIKGGVQPRRHTQREHQQVHQVPRPEHRQDPGFEAAFAAGVRSLHAGHCHAGQQNHRGANHEP